MKAGFNERRIRAMINLDPRRVKWEHGNETVERDGFVARRQTERNRGQAPEWAPEGIVFRQNLQVVIARADVVGVMPEEGQRIWLKNLEGEWEGFRVHVDEASSDQSHVCILLDEEAV